MPTGSAALTRSRPTWGGCPGRGARGRRRGAGITKAGSGRGRWLLIQAAVSMRRLRDPRTADLRDWAERIATRRGKKIAVVALARRLAGILFALLRDESVYEPRGDRPATARSSVPA